MRGINCEALWIKALYKCSPFTVYKLRHALVYLSKRVLPVRPPPSYTPTRSLASRVSFRSARWESKASWKSPPPSVGRSRRATAAADGFVPNVGSGVAVGNTIVLIRPDRFARRGPLRKSGGQRAVSFESELPMPAALRRGRARSTGLLRTGLWHLCLCPALQLPGAGNPPTLPQHLHVRSTGARVWSVTHKSLVIKVISCYYDCGSVVNLEPHFNATNNPLRQLSFI